MCKSLTERLADFVRPYSRGYRLAYLLVSASVVVLEVVFHTISAPLGASAALLLAALFVLLTVAPWLGGAGDLLYVPHSPRREQSPAAPRSRFPLLACS